MAKTKIARRRGGKRQAGRGKRVRKAGAKKANVMDFASLSVNRTYTVPGGGAAVANQMYSIMNTTLSQFDRAVQVAQGYQFYRIKYVSIKIKPQFDTYAFGVAGYGKPKCYYMLDKSATIPSTVTLEALKLMGARPRNLDERALAINFAPSVLSSALTSAPGLLTQPAMYKISPWLTTSSRTDAAAPWAPNDVDHLGVYWYVESTSYGGTGGLPYQIDVEVQFQFKKPLWDATGSSSAVGLVPAVIDASPDGVEGGSDGITIPLPAVLS